MISKTAAEDELIQILNWIDFMYSYEEKNSWHGGRSLPGCGIRDR